MSIDNPKKQPEYIITVINKEQEDEIYVVSKPKWKEKDDLFDLTEVGERKDGKWTFDWDNIVLELNSKKQLKNFLKELKNEYIIFV